MLIVIRAVVVIIVITITVSIIVMMAAVMLLREGIVYPSCSCIYIAIDPNQTITANRIAIARLRHFLLVSRFFRIFLSFMNL